MNYTPTLCLELVIQSTVSALFFSNCCWLQWHNKKSVKKWDFHLIWFSQEHANVWLFISFIYG